ncbi:putative reverse transcriptase domain-containing protein [Tanacetum coccineum]|uniref:Reverse transcriptase domain-containing protein n=1 Tax=Tanacetum coccineum TaxID=301880 RepID=A0ABQ5GNS3_9ASTR
MAPTTRRGPNTASPTDTNPNNMTPESVQAMIDQALLRNSTNGDGSHSSHGDNRRNVQTARPCFYADFMKCQPLNFKGAEGVVGLTRWIEKMESVFNISGCAVENQIRTLGPEAYAMTWEVLKRKMTDKYCPQGEIKKLEIELWNLKVKGNDVPAYTERFQELTLICTKFVANETEKVDKYLSGLPDNIYGNVKAAKPKTLDETIELANDLMDRKLLTYAERQSDNKRKADDSSRNNHGHQQQPFKRQNVAKVYNMGTGERKPYGGSLPRAQVPSHPQWPVAPKVPQCKQIGHFARDCRNTGNTNVANTQKGNGQLPREMVVLSLEAERGEMHTGNPDENVVTVRFIIGMTGKEDIHGDDRCDEKLCSKFSLLREGNFDFFAKQRVLSSTNIRKERGGQVGKETIEDVPIVQDFQQCFPRTCPGPSHQLDRWKFNRLNLPEPHRTPRTISDWPIRNEGLSEQLQQELSDKGS